MMSTSYTSSLTSNDMQYTKVAFPKTLASNIISSRLNLHICEYGLLFFLQSEYHTWTKHTKEQAAEGRLLAQDKTAH